MAVKTCCRLAIKMCISHILPLDAHNSTNFVIFPTGLWFVVLESCEYFALKMEAWMYNKEHILTFGDFDFLSDVMQEGAHMLCSKWQVPPQPLKSPQVPLKGRNVTRQNPKYSSYAISFSHCDMLKEQGTNLKCTEHWKSWSERKPYYSKP